MLLFRLGLTIPQLFLATALFNLVVAVYIIALVPEFLLRFLSWILIHTLYGLRKENADRIPEEGAALLVCNFVSRVDTLVVLAASPRPIRFVLDQRFFRVPLLGFLLRRTGAIPVAPDPVVLARAHREIARTFLEGDLVAIFPEGGLLEPGTLGAFDQDLLPFLTEASVPILPIGLGGGLWSSHFSRTGATRFTGALGARVTLKVGEPLAPGTAPEAVRGGLALLVP